MNLAQPNPHVRAVGRIFSVAAVFTIAGACASALVLHLEIAAPVYAIAHQDSSSPQKPIRVSGAVMAGQIISKVNPEYPPEAKEQGLSGAVVLHAIIGTDGAVKDLEVISGAKELQNSALDAVRQWVYKPYLLNGNPVEVDTTITVTYSLAP